MAQPQPAKNFVLVHGAWHGGWCWRRVADLLRARGHRVFTPTLTGLADRSHLLNANITLATHVADIVNLLRWEELSDVVLCGHSYGGAVITLVAEQAAARLGALVYLDAFLPQDGQSLSDITGLVPAEETMPPRSAASFRVNAADAGWVDAQCTPHPAASFTQRLAVGGAYRGVARKTYIWARDYAGPHFTRLYETLRQDPAWQCHAAPCGHDVMLDQPEFLAEALLAA